MPLRKVLWLVCLIVFLAFAALAMTGCGTTTANMDTKTIALVPDTAQHASLWLIRGSPGMLVDSVLKCATYATGDDYQWATTPGTWRNLPLLTHTVGVATSSFIDSCRPAATLANHLIVSMTTTGTSSFRFTDARIAGHYAKIVGLPGAKSIQIANMAFIGGVQLTS